AVLGREARAATIARMTEALPAAVIDAMTPALDAGIVVESAWGHFAFSHILVRDAVEDGLPALERARLHGAAAIALGSAADPSRELIARRARHALAAPEPGGAAIALGLRAADLLEGLGALDRALSMHERVEDARRAGLGPPAKPAERLRVARLAQNA